MINCTFENGGKGSLRHVTVTALVVRHNEILLVKRAPNLLAGNLYGLPGGFLDRNEHVFQGVKRELLEETGYESKDVELFRINDKPDRRGEDRQNVDFVFLITPGEKTGKPDAENTEVFWSTFDKLPKEETFAFDYYENIQLFLKYKKEQFPLPVLLH